MNPISVFSAKRAPERINVTTERIAIAGPAGYCIDPAATKDGSETAFVLLGSCASISQSPEAAAPARLALLTASVSSKSSFTVTEAIESFDPFFRSEPGRAALSRAGDPETVEVLETIAEQDMFLMHVRDRSSNVLGKVEETYWRALFDVEGALVTVTVIGFESEPLSDASGRQTLAAFVAQIRRANGAVPPSAAPPQPTSESGGRRFALLLPRSQG